MPLPKYAVQPVRISHVSVPSFVQNELEYVANATFSNLMRQMSSISQMAGDMFKELTSELSLLAERTMKLKSRIVQLHEDIHVLKNFDEDLSVGVQNLSMEPYVSDKPSDSQVLAHTTLPPSMEIRYSNADPPPAFHTIDCLRDDGKISMKLYSDPSFFFDLWSEEMLQETKSKKVAKKKRPKAKLKAISNRNSHDHVITIQQHGVGDGLVHLVCSPNYRQQLDRRSDANTPQAISNKTPLHSITHHDSGCINNNNDQLLPPPPPPPTFPSTPATTSDNYLAPMSNRVLLSNHPPPPKAPITLQPYPQHSQPTCPNGIDNFVNGNEPSTPVHPPPPPVPAYSQASGYGLSANAVNEITYRTSATTCELDAHHGDQNSVITNGSSNDMSTSLTSRDFPPPPPMCDGPLPSPPPPLADQIPLNGPLQVPLDGSEAEANVARLEPSPPPPPPPPQVLPILQAGTISKPSVVATNSGPPQDLLSAIRAGYQLRKVSDRQTGSGVTNGYNTNTLNSKPRDVQAIYEAVNRRRQCMENNSDDDDDDDKDESDSSGWED